MSNATYLTEETARSAARYIRGPQVSSVRVVRREFGAYQPVIFWKDGSISHMKVWQAEWFSINIGVQNG